MQQRGIILCTSCNFQNFWTPRQGKKTSNLEILVKLAKKSSVLKIPLQQISEKYRTSTGIEFVPEQKPTVQLVQQSDNFKLYMAKQMFYNVTKFVSKLKKLACFSTSLRTTNIALQPKLSVR